MSQVAPATPMEILIQKHDNPLFGQPVASNLADPFSLSDEDGYFWLKGNLHCHTIFSDGRITPQERVDGYVARGFDFLCLSDHQVITPVHDLDRPEDFILIPGAELHPDNPFGGQVHHILALNLTRTVDAFRMPPQHVINAVREQGGSPWLPHPHWSSIIVSRDVLPLRGLAGLEVVNTECLGMGRSEGAVHWDDWMWLTGSLKPAIGVDDAHGGFEPREGTGRAWTFVRVRERSIPAIIQALERGASYASTGPKLHHVSIQPGGRNKGRPVFQVRVGCSPAIRVLGICDVYGGSFYQGGQVFTEAVFDLPSMARWVRIEVIDPTGAKAWSNPVLLSAD